MVYMLINISLQEEVIREVGAEALQLGLLIGTEDPNPQEEETEMLCFPHSLFQEFVAAHYIAEVHKVLNLFDTAHAKMLKSLNSHSHFCKDIL